MTLEGLRTQLRRHIDDRTEDRFVDAELDEELNEAQRAIQLVINAADEGFFSDVQCYDVVASTDSYEFDLPSNLMKVNAAEREVAGGVPIPAEWVNFGRRHIEGTYALALDLTNSEAPRCYLRGAKIGVVAPSSSYSLRLWFTYAIPDLASDSDESEIPAEHRQLLCLHAAKMILGADQKGDVPGWLEDAYTKASDALRAYIETRQRQASREVVYDPDC
jgi:hypothetical protein